MDFIFVCAESSSKRWANKSMNEAILGMLSVVKIKLGEER